MALLKEVFQRIEGYRDVIIKLQEDLTSKVALGPESGGTGEHDKAKYLEKKLEEAEARSFKRDQGP